MHLELSILWCGCPVCWFDFGFDSDFAWWSRMHFSMRGKIVGILELSTRWCMCHAYRFGLRFWFWLCLVEQGAFLCWGKIVGILELGTRWCTCHAYGFGVEFLVLILTLTLLDRVHSNMRLEIVCLFFGIECVFLCLCGFVCGEMVSGSDPKTRLG